jgi:IS605 OrfB family transposase
MCQPASSSNTSNHNGKEVSKIPLRVITAKIVLNSENKEHLISAMLSATKVYNGLLWNLRQEYEKTGKSKISRKNLNRIMKTLPRAKDYYSLAVQSTRDEVIGAYRSFFTLRQSGHTEHHNPGFRRKSCLSPLKYLQSGFSIKDGSLALSLGNSREDGAKSVAMQLQHRPDVSLDTLKIKGVTITYDKHFGFNAHLVIETPPAEPVSSDVKCTVDLGETNLISAVFSDGSTAILSGRLLKACRRYWQKVRSRVKPPSKDNPHVSKRFEEIAHRESDWTNNFLHQASRWFVDLCKEKGVSEIAIGNLTDIREEIDYGARLNQRLHAWPFAKLAEMLRYKAEDAGIAFRQESEAYTSQTCHACGKVSKAARKHRGLYSCSCGYRANADLNGAANLFKNTYKVSPWGTTLRSSGDATSPTLVARFTGHTVCELAL